MAECKKQKLSTKVQGTQRNKRCAREKSASCLVLLSVERKKRWNILKHWCATAQTAALSLSLLRWSWQKACWTLETLQQCAHGPFAANILQLRQRALLQRLSLIISNIESETKCYISAPSMWPENEARHPKQNYSHRPDYRSHSANVHDGTALSFWRRFYMSSTEG